MNKKLVYLFCIGAYSYAPFLQQEFKTYQSQFKKMPLLSYKNRTEHTKQISEPAVSFQQKIGFEKKRLKYTLALRY